MGCSFRVPPDDLYPLLGVSVCVCVYGLRASNLKQALRMIYLGPRSCVWYACKQPLRCTAMMELGDQPPKQKECIRLDMEKRAGALGEEESCTEVRC